jgi:hypothetical protein
MLTEIFCERLERELLPDVKIVEIPTDWDKAGTHNRVPSCLVLVRGGRVFPRHDDMIALISPKLKQPRLTFKSFDHSLGIDWYIKEWEYDKARVELFTSIRDRASEASKTQESRLVESKLPDRISPSILKSLLQRGDDLFVSMLLGRSGVEIKQLCQIERQKLGDISTADVDPYGYYYPDRTLLGQYRTVERLVNLYQLPTVLHR